MAERVLFEWKGARGEEYVLLDKGTGALFVRNIRRGYEAPWGPMVYDDGTLVRALLAALDEVTERYREARDREAVTERELEDTRAALDEERAKVERLEAIENAARQVRYQLKTVHLDMGGDHRYTFSASREAGRTVSALDAALRAADTEGRE